MAAAEPAPWEARFIRSAARASASWMILAASDRARATASSEDTFAVADWGAPPFSSISS